MRKPTGFTIIELMVVVALIGILSAVAIPAYLGYMKKTRVTEVDEQLDAIAKKQKTVFAETSSYTPGAAAKLPQNPTLAAPGLECCGGKGGSLASSAGAGSATVGKCTGDPAAWAADPVWNRMGFAISEETAYRYDYAGSAPDHYTAHAYGDTDCDGNEAVFTLEGTIDVAGTPNASVTRPAAGIY
jgi:type IV pilus assembly protein PilA